MRSVNVPPCAPRTSYLLTRLALAMGLVGCVGEGRRERLEGDSTSDTMLEVDLADTAQTCPDRCADLEPDPPPCFAAVWNLETCTCALVARPDESPCDDGDACTNEDRCAGGECVGVLVDLGRFCDDGDDCTSDACDPSLGCVHQVLEGALCDDKNVCTFDSRCDASGACRWRDQYVCGLCDPADPNACAAENEAQDACNGRLVCRAGYCEVDSSTTPRCDDPRRGPCVAARCEAGACVYEPRADGLACSDGSGCTKDDTCRDGVCVGTPIDLAACRCSEDEACLAFDDADPCNGKMRCEDGTCGFDFASIVVCDRSGDTTCSATHCEPGDAGDGVCVVEARHEGLECDDGDPCTVGERCGGGSCAGPPRDCSAYDVACFIGVCDLERGCVSRLAEAGTTCVPSSGCSMEGRCNAAGECVSVAEECDDGDLCTVDFCDESARRCSHLGPERPRCPELGVCAAGVPVVCDAGAYRCDFRAVAGWNPVERCDGLDDDCDGATDVLCIASEACPEGEPRASWGGTMQACALSAAPSAGACATGWHPCSYASMVEALGGDAPPSGYYITASIRWSEASGFALHDRPGEACMDLDGICTLAREVQAMSWDGVFGATIAYAAEAWGCAEGVPVATCETARFEGVLCCMDQCDADSDCADASPCSVDRCEAGRCVHDEPAKPTCLVSGVCSGLGPTCMPDGTWSCDYHQIPDWEAVEARCDGLDNDCDAKVDVADPDFAPTRPLCERQLGVCAGSEKRRSLCATGRWEACTATDYEGHSVDYEDGYEARCDGLDNDCDGVPDGGFAWQGRVIGQSCDGVGECGLGVVECDPSGSRATCSTNPSGSASQAKPELCNGRDDDCDGQIDEVSDLDPDAAACPSLGVCAHGVDAVCLAGAWLCQLERVEGYGVESCDGLDNNCDGATDEGFLWSDGVTLLGVGEACDDPSCVDGGASVVVCGPDGEAVCSGQLGGELCDGVDNDCDGLTDEEIVYADAAFGPVPLGGGCSGRGACGPGQVECGAGLRAVCSTFAGGSASQATPERCNGTDDDCDGVTDEGFVYDDIPLGGACVGLGRCGAGVVVCAASGSAATCSSQPDGGQSQARPETCDGVDEDCDGLTDEGVVAGNLECPSVGVCRPEVLNASCLGAGGWRCDYAASPYFQAGDELGRCDGRDNDCDGQTDEDFAGGPSGLGLACDGADADLCARGAFACDPNDPTRTVCVGDLEVVESCNGQDDDCDGQTDEEGALGCATFYSDVDGDTWGVATPTKCLCGPSGTFTATRAGDCAPTQPGINPGAGERCNGLDDDCDSKTDASDAADLIVNDPQPCELTQGVCQGAMKPASRCVNGAWQACTNGDYNTRNADYQASESKCDGKDNDCDGLSDGADPELAANRPLCETQKGVCAGARKPASLCVASGWGACTGVSYLVHSSAYEAPNEATCDGLDNDCDGGVDDDFTWGNKKVGQACDGTGACGLGTVECRADGSSATCSTNADGSASQAVAELCNTVDDDCDGVVNNGLGVAQSPCRKVGVCRPDRVVATCSPQGAWSCNYTNVVGYEAGTELSCDALDNDCDGASDEDFALVLGGQTLRKGDACGAGACQGAVVCFDTTPAPGDLVCSAELAAQPELCDHQDNDCDGQTDEGLMWTRSGGVAVPLGAGCTGYGRCGAGTVECNAALGTTCSSLPDGSQSQAVVETCNRIDDDCDQATDEGFTWQGLALGQTCDGAGRCGLGVVECADPAIATCSTNANGSASQAVAEVCNGEDDDCDGATDEGLGVLDSTCRLVGQCTRFNVVATCGGVSGWACDYGAVPAYQSGGELGLCDGLDNDCDGATDEDFADLGKACDSVSDADLCAKGVWACGAAAAGFGPPSSASPICVGDVASFEQCGNGDEDCDGVTDEAGALGCKIYFRDDDGDGFGLAGDFQCLCAPSGKYTAQNTSFDCDDGDGAVHPGARERCNEVDDNCDGDVDEDGASECVPYYVDQDQDGFGTGDDRCLCWAWQGDTTGHTTPLSGDCDDHKLKVNPAAPEVCDEVDNDCDGRTDDDDPVPAGCVDYYYDGDGDGAGLAADRQCRCKAAGKYRALVAGDCCDVDQRVFPGQQGWFKDPSACQTRDYDCSGAIDLEWRTYGACGCTVNCGAGCSYTPGWLLRPAGAAEAQAIPACGQTGIFVESCLQANAMCTSSTGSRPQRCR